MLDREIMAGQMMAFRVTRPEGFNFLAGQFCLITVPDTGFQDAAGLRRPLSIASSPLEKHLLFTVRLTDSAFKRTLREMPEGRPIDIEGPVGQFILPQDTEIPLVFLAGGVGVAPFRSMMRYVADAPTGHRVTVFYSSRVPEEALFLEEFEEIAGRLPFITVVTTITRPEQSATKWSGPTGRLTAQVIKERCKDWSRAIYYVSGPPVMVEGMRVMLGGMEIDQGHIKQEVWTGY
jgi:ferredoxin-NADP reductase